MTAVPPAKRQPAASPRAAAPRKRTARPPAGALLVGIDVGQTVVKVALFDDAGHELALARADSRVSSPEPGWHERDLDEVWADAASAIGRVLQGYDATRVRAVGLTGHNEGAYLVDADGRPSRPGVLAIDTRAATQAERLLWTRDQFLTVTGQIPFAGSPAAILRWVRASEPEVYERFRWQFFAKDWVRLRLTGEVATDRTDASAAFVDVHTQRWSAEAFALCDLRGDLDRMPPMLRSDEVAGTVTAEAAAATGLAAGTPVVAGAHDADADALGMGAIEVRRMSLVLGTIGINQVVSDLPQPDGHWRARSFLVPQRWLHMSTSPTGAGNLAWAVRLLGPHGADGQPDFVAALAEAEAAHTRGTRDHRPVFLPFLVGDPFTPPLGASFTGLREADNRADLLLSVVRGAAHSHRWHVDLLRQTLEVEGPIRVGGGGSRSEFWTRLLSEVLGVPLEITDAGEAGARGAAMLAGLGAGLYENLDDAVRRCVRVVRTVEPTPAGIEREAVRYADYLALIAALRGA